MPGGLHAKLYHAPHISSFLLIYLLTVHTTFSIVNHPCGQEPVQGRVMCIPYVEFRELSEDFIHRLGETY